MNRKVLGGVIALLVVIVGVWFFFVRGDKDNDAGGEQSGSDRTGKVALDKKAQPTDSNDGPRPIKPRWSIDPDPEGPLRLEGQVIGPDKKPVAGPDVWLASVPP